jgi:large subunit ribosomal protein L13
MTKTYTIDAAGKKIGRIASDAAAKLSGKNLVTFARNAVADVTVEIKNVGKLQIGEKKMLDKEYRTYSGYPGGLSSEKLGALVDRKGVTEALKRAIYGMIPSNKLRSRIMKNLTISE